MQQVFRRYSNPDAIIWHVYVTDHVGTDRIHRVTGNDLEKWAHETVANIRGNTPGLRTWVVPCKVTIDPPERFENEAGLLAHFEAMGILGAPHD